jgi:hypothetical protein
MSKYRELKNELFNFEWFMYTNYKTKKELLYKIAKLETENRFNDLTVEKLISYSYFSNTYTILQLVNMDNNKYIMIINLTKKGNKIFYNYVTLISKYDFK